MGSSFCDWVIRCCEKYNAVFETNGQQATQEPRHGKDRLQAGRQGQNFMTSKNNPRQASSTFK